MTTSIAAPLSADAYEAKAGANYTVFNFRLGKKYFDHNTNANQWTNYQVGLFVRNDQEKKIQLMREVLVKGTVVEVAATNVKACIGQTGEGVQYPYIELLKPQLIDFYTMKQQAGTE